MQGIQYVTDDKGEKIAVQINLRKFGGIWDEKIINRLFPKIENLSVNPRPAGFRKLAGNKYLWRIRAGSYRIVYSINDDKYLVDIIAVRDRKDAYK